MRLLVTGGSGFIGSAFIRLTIKSEPDTEVLNFDSLTYAGNLENLAEVAENNRYRFVKGNVVDSQAVDHTIAEWKPDAIVHFAAESHVDRSIISPQPAIETNFNGTFQLLEAARKYKIARYLQISTDEVYGSIDEPAEADETYPLKPSSPYSASKAAADLLTLSYFTTYKLDVVVTRASNNSGPYQFPEKLIPLMISNAIEDQPLPVYGDGVQVRDWLWVDDHCRAIQAVLKKGRSGEIYNIGGSRTLPNIDVVEKILAAVGKPNTLIKRIEDRPGHDQRYAITSDKVVTEVGWTPQVEFEQGLAEVIKWYRKNADWVTRVRSGEYRDYYEKNYAHRGTNLPEL